MARTAVTRQARILFDDRYSLNFSGANNANVTLGTSFNPSVESFTVMMAVKILDFPVQPPSGSQPGFPDNIAFYAQLDGTGTGRTWLGIRYNLANGLCRINSNFNNTFRNATVGINFNEWTLVGLRYNRQTQVMNLFKNGVSVGTFSGFVPESADGSHIIGTNKTGVINQTIGKISNVRVWKTALSDAEILALYKNQEVSQTALEAEYKCKEGEGSSLIDTSGNDAHGTINAGVTWDTDRYGGLRAPGVGASYSLHFDGVDGRAIWDGQTGIEADAPFSMGGWFKTELQFDDFRLFAGMGSYDPLNPLVPGLVGMGEEDVATGGDNEQQGKVIVGQPGDVSGPIPDTDRRTISPGQWTHIACTFDGTTKRIYLNGRLVTGDIETRTYNLNSGSFFLMSMVIPDLAVSVFTAGNALKAFLYNTALSSEEIFGIYQNENFPLDGRVDVWEIQEGSGNESIGLNGNTMDIEGGATWSGDVPGSKRTVAGARTPV